MKTINKARLRSTALAVLALLLSGAFPAQGQDLVREIPFPDNHSIVRYYYRMNWLIYSQGTNNMFHMTSPLATNVEYKVINDHHIKIHDFEIYDDYVYFCGTYDDKDTQQALLGYFPLDSFPKGPVYFDTFPYLASFDKLDVFPVEDQIQIIMTGRYNSGFGTMVNVMEVSPGTGTWMYYYTNMKERKYLFDDVAITDSYGVYTSRNDYDELKYGETDLWYFPRPTSSGIPLLQSGVTKRHLYNESTSPVLIEYMQEDSIAIACFSHNTHVSVSKLHGLQYVGTVEYPANVEKDSVRDIKYNFDDMELDILEGRTGFVTDHIISHVSGSHFVSGGALPFHEFYDHCISSIDYLSTSSSLFVASGHEAESMNLHTYKYKYNYWGDCTMETMCPIDVVDIEVEDIEEDNSLYYYVRDFKEVVEFRGEVGIETKCGIK